ncbi:MAG TPA: hypothetical protein PLG33_07705 [Prolixibacteraceae bacterium]|nr:hypothetical protein [Prolixibacteraceae bacterium]
MKSFTEISSIDYQKSNFQEIEQEIESAGKDYLLRVEQEEYAEYLFNQYYKEPVTVSFEDEIIEEPIVHKEKITDRFLGEQYLADVYYITVKYPYRGSSIIFRLRPNSFTLTSGEITITDSFVSFVIKVIDKDPDEFLRRKNEVRNNSFRNLQSANSDIISYNAQLKSFINSTIQRFKDKYLKGIVRSKSDI